MNPDLIEGGRWPLDWRSLYPRERRLWWEQLWVDVCALRDRYRLAVRSGWWEHSIQVEALARIPKQRIGTWLGAQANWKRSCRPFHQGISIAGRSAVRMIGL